MSGTNNFVINTLIADECLVAAIRTRLEVLFATKQPELKMSVEAYNILDMPDTLVTLHGIALFSLTDWLIEISDG